jgi:syndecan 1
MVGPCVLGGLQPRLLVVTTPNWEANRMIRAAEVAQRGAAALAASGGTKAATGGSQLLQQLQPMWPRAELWTTGCDY